MKSVPTQVFIPKVDVRGPVRRRLLIEATIRVMIRDGISGVTHRSVSEEAGLPVTATTYYFSTLDALLSATFRALYEAFIRDPAPVAATAPANPGDALGSVVDAFFDLIAGRRESYRVLFELQLAASRRPDLRGHSMLFWEAQIHSVQALLDVSPETARALVAMFDGHIVANLSTGSLPHRDQFRAQLAAIVAVDTERQSERT